MNNSMTEYRGQKILFNQYEKYPAENKNGWIELVLDKHQNAFLDKDKTIIDVNDNNSAILIEVNASSWDYNHFGYKIANINNPLIINQCKSDVAKESIKKALAVCVKAGIKFIVSRVNGDNLELIHALEDSGFKYYETIIWPVSDLRKIHVRESKTIDISILDPLQDDIERVKDIADRYQYQRGHYHCDEKIDKAFVNSLYAKWVQSAFESGKRIVLIKYENKIAGYFICDIDQNLSKYLGVRYGRLQSLSLDSTYRGRGLGRNLFEGTLQLLKENGCFYVDSGYATKNHASAKLHAQNGFSSVYEEVTMHCWLSE